jgi:hypothetical protein
VDERAPKLARRPPDIGDSEMGEPPVRMKNPAWGDVAYLKRLLL